MSQHQLRVRVTRYPLIFALGFQCLLWGFRLNLTPLVRLGHRLCRRSIRVKAETV